MSNASASLMARVQKTIDAAFAAIIVKVALSGLEIAGLIEVVEDYFLEGIKDDTPANRAAAAKAGQPFESWRFTGQKQFARSHDQSVSTVKGKRTVTWVYNPAKAAQVLRLHAIVKSAMAELDNANQAVEKKVK